MKLGITGGLEYYQLESEKKRLKKMNGLRRCTAHGHLTEYVPCEDCRKEGKTEEYEDWFLGKPKDPVMERTCDVCGQVLVLSDDFWSCPVYMAGKTKNADEHTSIPTEEKK